MMRRHLARYERFGLCFDLYLFPGSIVELWDVLGSTTSSSIFMQLLFPRHGLHYYTSPLSTVILETLNKSIKLFS